MVVQGRGSRDAAHFAAASPDGPAPTIATFLTENLPVIMPAILFLNINSGDVYSEILATLVSATYPPLISSWINGVNHPLTNALPIFGPSVVCLDSRRLAITFSGPSSPTCMHDIVQYALESVSE